MKQGGKVQRKKLLASRRLDGGKNEYDYVLETLMEQGRVQNIGGTYVLKVDEI